MKMRISHVMNIKSAALWECKLFGKMSDEATIMSALSKPRVQSGESDRLMPFASLSLHRISTACMSCIVGILYGVGITWSSQTRCVLESQELELLARLQMPHVCQYVSGQRSEREVSPVSPTDFGNESNVLLFRLIDVVLTYRVEM